MRHNYIVKTSNTSDNRANKIVQILCKIEYTKDIIPIAGKSEYTHAKR